GTGIHVRTDEYGRLLYKTMQQLIQLYDANSIMGGSERVFYKQVTEMKNLLENLESSGDSLIEITALKRVDSVNNELKFWGIEEFNTSVSSETAIYRSLTKGDSSG